MSARTGLGRRAPLLLLSGVLGVALLSGCGSSPLKSRYLAERDLFRAGKIEKRFNLRQTKDDALASEVETAYRKVLERHPLSSAGGDRQEQAVLIRVRGAAASALARVHLQTGSMGGAIRDLYTIREEARGDLETGVSVYGDLLSLLVRSSRGDTLETILTEIAQKLPPGTPDGRPIPLVLEAPLRLADLKATTKSPDAPGALEQAFGFYERTAHEATGKALEVAALVQEANVRVRQGRAAEAEQILGSARALPQAGPYEAGILYSLGTVREQGLKDPLGAIQLYRQIVRLHPDEPTAAQASLRIGICFTEAGMTDSADVAYQRTEDIFGKDTNLAAQARFLAAKSLLAAGRGPDAVRRFRSVTADYPRTEAGLQAPIEIANYFKTTRDATAENAGLREAQSEYERIVQDLTSARTSPELIVSALDHLANVRARLKDWPGTVEVLNQRADGFPGDAGSPLSLVQAAAIRNDYLSDRQGSIELLKKMLQRYPGHPLAQKVRDKIAQLGG